MMFSLHRMFSLFNGWPHLPHRPAQPIEAPDRQSPAPPPPAESPGFLHPEFAPFEPDLTQEVRQALGEEAARHVGEAP